ncbi:MAG: class I SAM-dependent methyltransferase [Candidatus Zixiibacteriota bacterium]
MGDEQKRIDAVFKGRAGLEEKYAIGNAGNAFNLRMLTGQLKAFLDRLRTPLESLKLLDTGAGQLFWPELFIQFGLKRKHCFGTDLLHWRLAKGHADGRDVSAVTADAATMPFADNQFDIVTQFTLLTSVLDPEIKKNIASEMMRVLKPGGHILWYDFRYDNPANENTKAIGKAEIVKLFRPLKAEFQTITLLPPLARKIPRSMSPILTMLYLFPILRSHYLAIIGPKG